MSEENIKKFKVTLKKDALIIDSKKTPAHAGYTQHKIDWRQSISEILSSGLVHEVSKNDILGDSCSIQHPEKKYFVHIPSYMIESIEEIDLENENKNKKRPKVK